MSREIVRDHGVMMLLGSMRAGRAPRRLPLLNMSQRFTARGFRRASSNLRMTRGRSAPTSASARDGVRAFAFPGGRADLGAAEAMFHLLDPPGRKRLIQHQHGAR